MPFVSEAQRKFAFVTHQPWAERWAHETPKGKRLPARVGKRKAKRGRRRAKKRSARRR